MHSDSARLKGSWTIRRGQFVADNSSQDSSSRTTRPNPPLYYMGQDNKELVLANHHLSPRPFYYPTVG